MKEKLKELFDYNNVMNQRIIILMTTHYNQLSEKSFHLLSHTLNAHQIWNARILKEKEFGVWQINDWNTVAEINEQNYRNSLQILTKENLNQIIHYFNSKGEAFENKLEDILFHVINHSTYHRGQIASQCRESGIEPLMTDYIMYKRV